MGQPRWGRVGNILLTALLLAVPAEARPRPPRIEVPAVLQAWVVGVTDGDTVKVHAPGLPELRVRLLGIDAPESGQDFGKVAKRVLADKVMGRELLLHTRGLDRYGRVLAKLLCDGVDVNLAMVREGLAWHYAHYASTQHSGDAALYARAEAQARAGRVGLWAYPDPVPPWEWRRKRH